MREAKLRWALRSIMSWLLIFSLSGLSTSLMAKERRGATVVIQKKDGSLEKGELIAVKQNSLLILGASSGADVAIDVPDIRTVRIVKERKAVTGLWWGFIIGTGAALATGLINGNDETGEVFAFGSVQDAVLTSSLFGLLVGGTVGAAVGAFSGDKILRFESKGDLTIQAQLKKLRAKARIRDAR